MSLLIRLPEILAVEILSQWCGLHSVGMFDSAICNSSERHHVMSILSSQQFVTKWSDQVGYSGYLSWICLREISLSELHIDDNILDGYKASHILKLTVSSPFKTKKASTSLIQFINSCPKLQSLRIQGRTNFTEDMLFNLDTKLLAQLVTFKAVYNI